MPSITIAEKALYYKQIDAHKASVIKMSMANMPNCLISISKDKNVKVN